MSYHKEVDEIEALNKRIAELKEEIQDRADTEASLVKQLVKTGDRLKEAKELLKRAYERRNSTALVWADVEALLNEQGLSGGGADGD